MKRLLIAAAAATGLMLMPAVASASTCGDDGTTKWFDNQGYYFDFTQSDALTPDHNDPFASLYDGGTNAPGDTPPGPVTTSDSYDDFGALFVGGTDDSHLYFSADNNSCTDPTASEHDFPVVPLAGLNVQRKVFVNATGPLPGARILNLLSNPTTAPITTTVQIGDLTSTSNDDDLGSDDTTAVRASSNGDAVASPADYWAVTNDAPDTTDDATLAHVVDGHGAVKTNLFQIGGGTNSSAPEDNAAWGWTVTVPAGRTVGLLSAEVQKAVAGRDSATEVADAAAVAAGYEVAPMSTIYQGMSAGDAASIVNWPQPPVKKKCKKHKKKHHGKKSAAAAKKHKKCKKHKKKK
jgi:hypothetical protein